MSDLIPPEYTRVTSILSTFQSYSAVPSARLKKAQDTGTAVHLAIEKHLRNEFHPLESIVQPYFDSFLAWKDNFLDSTTDTEKRLFDDDLMITGQLDLIGIVQGQNCLVDFKTGSWVHKEIWELQLTFYRYLLMQNKYQSPPDKMMVVHLKKDGSKPDIFAYDYDQRNFGVCYSAWCCYKFFNKDVVVN